MDPSADGEGECSDCCCVNHLQCPSKADVDERMTCEFIRGPSIATATHFLQEAPDISAHVSNGWLSSMHCYLSGLSTSFGPLGLLCQSSPELSAVVDTGASLCVTPQREDFETYRKASGRVLKGLTKGVPIPGTGAE